MRLPVNFTRIGCSKYPIAKMQSHQSTLSQDAQKNKMFCHKRRPSIGKSMPVTALLLNYPPPAKDYERLGTDGLRPEEMEKPPLFFAVDDDQLNRRPINDVDENDSDDSGYEVIDFDASAPSVPIRLAGNDDITSCGFCSESECADRSEKAGEPSTLKQLCDKLCNDQCKTTSAHRSVHDMEDLAAAKSDVKISSPKVVHKSLLKVPSKIDLERKKFLDGILKDVDLDKVADIDFDQNVEPPQKPPRKYVTEIEATQSDAVQMDKKMFHEKLKVAEALARTSMMTSPAARRRLAARKIEMELDFGRINPDASEFVPPRDLLLYLVRMGSFNSAPKICNADTQDDHLIVPHGLTCEDLIKHFRTQRGENRPQLLRRQYLNPISSAEDAYSNELQEKFRALNVANPLASAAASNKSPSASNQIRVFQWNILSQTLGQKNDNFVCCPDEALTWENRKYLIVEEILQNDPDIICLQEVDHFKFLERILGSQNYTGIFFPKPDSPCLYVEENNGPDGCAIFYKRDKFELLNYDTRILEVWHVQSNQVAIIANLKLKDTDEELSVCTTHLKARHGALLSKLRNEQGKDLLKFVADFCGNRPIIMCGDFNAEPIEPVYSTVLNNKELELSSAYAEINKQIEEQNRYQRNGIDITDDANKDLNDAMAKEQNNIAETMAKKEPAYTTWKIRDEGEICHTIDYVFYSKNNFKVRNCLLFPDCEEIGKDRTPSFRYPSDHFSLVCDFELVKSPSAPSPESSNINSNAASYEKL